MGRTRKTAHASLGRALVNTKKNTQGDKSAHQVLIKTFDDSIQN